MNNLEKARKLKERINYFKKTGDKNAVRDLIKELKALKNKIFDTGLERAESSEDITNDLKSIKLIDEVLNAN